MHPRSQTPPPLSAQFPSPRNNQVQATASTWAQHCDKVANDHLSAASQYLSPQKNQVLEVLQNKRIFVAEV